eukprot:7655751-Pyramimonas_sp.AAC.3
MPLIAIPRALSTTSSPSGLATTASWGSASVMRCSMGKCGANDKCETWKYNTSRSSSPQNSASSAARSSARVLANFRKIEPPTSKVRRAVSGSLGKASFMHLRIEFRKRVKRLPLAPHRHIPARKQGVSFTSSGSSSVSLSSSASMLRCMWTQAASSEPIKLWCFTPMSRQYWTRPSASRAGLLASLWSANAPATGAGTASKEDT